MFRATKTQAAARLLLVAATWLGVAGFAVPADAQETREEEIAKKQAEKAKTAAPYVPNKFEAVMARIESAFVSPPSGFYPAFGSIYPGGGFRAGVGLPAVLCSQCGLGHRWSVLDQELQED